MVVGCGERVVSSAEAVRMTVESSVLRAVEYDPTMRVMNVEFRDGSAYAYVGVVEEDFARMTNSLSTGAFFNQHIKGKHNFMKIFCSGSITVDSDAIRLMHYDNASGRLTVEFNNKTVYRYADVPESTVQELIEADSKGTYLATTIKPNYEAVKQ